MNTQFSLPSALKTYFTHTRSQLKTISQNSPSSQQNILWQNIAFQVFLEIDLPTSTPPTAEFRILFHASKLSTQTILKHSAKTIPFFASLPGFTHKKFMVHPTSGHFAGIYTWQSQQHIHAYLNSYAVKAMQLVSAPHPIYYEIIDLPTKQVILSKTIPSQTQLQSKKVTGK